MLAIYVRVPQFMKVFPKLESARLFRLMTYHAIVSFFQSVIRVRVFGKGQT